jgi:hypothetical protein
MYDSTYIRTSITKMSHGHIYVDYILYVHTFVEFFLQKKRRAVGDATGLTTVPARVACCSIL